MTPSTREQDLQTLARLNADYLASDQNSDVARYEQFLAPEFTASLPDYKLYDRAAFLELVGKPRPFTDLVQDFEGRREIRSIYRRIPEAGRQVVVHRWERDQRDGHSRRVTSPVAASDTVPASRTRPL